MMRDLMKNPEELGKKYDKFTQDFTYSIKKTDKGCELNTTIKVDLNGKKDEINVKTKALTFAEAFKKLEEKIVELEQEIDTQEEIENDKK